MTIPTRARRLVAAGPVPALVRGRARTDRWPLLVAVAVVALTAFLTVVTPRLADRTADQAVHDAVARAGPAADTTITVPFEDLDRTEPFTDPAGETTRVLPELTGALPPELGPVVADPVAAVLTRALPLTLPPASRLPVTQVRLAWLWRNGGPEVSWVAGSAPGATAADGTAVQVALSEDVAAALAVRAGDHLTAQGSAGPTDLTVTGVFRAADPGDRTWAGEPRLLRPRTTGTGPAARADVAALLSDASLPAARSTVDVDEVTRTVSFAATPDRLDAAGIDPVVAALTRLRTAPPVVPGVHGVRVDSRLGTVLLDTQDQVRAAQAQAPVLLTGVVAAAALVLLLSGQLLAERRRPVLATVRARGASLPATAAELLLESAVVAASGAGLAVLLAQLVVPGPVPVPQLAAVVAVAVLAGPSLGVVAAARATGGRRVPADRRRRRALRRDRQLRRVAVEVAVVVLAAGAFAALRVRGVLASADRPGGDLLLSAAPTLGLLAGGLLLLRLLPPLVRLALGRTTRSRHAVPLLAAARGAGAATSTTPVLALTLVTGLVTLSVTLGATVRAGQVDGSWAAVGSDATVTAEPTAGLAGVADRLAAQPGVDLAVPGRVEPGVQLFAATGGSRATVLVVDPRAFAELLDRTPLPDAPDLDRLAAPGGPATPALVSADLPVRANAGTALLWNDQRVPFQAVGRVPALAPGSGTTVLLPAGSLPPEVTDLGLPDTLWIVGDGAAQAVTGSPELAGTGTVLRADRLAAERAAPLTAGLTRLMTASALTLGVLGVLVVLLGAQVGAPERGRSLATVRTLGLTGRQARAVTSAELLPPVLLAGVVGAGLGVLTAALLTAPLELQRITGQTQQPPVVVPWWLPAAVLPLVLAVGAVVALESSLRRRERLGEVLRVGGQASG